MPEQKTTTHGAAPMQAAETAHTPGPWEIDWQTITGPKERHALTPYDGDRRTPSEIVAIVEDCETANYKHYSPARAAANRCLIAAAPDLLSALQGIFEAAECHTEVFTAKWSESEAEECARLKRTLDEARAAIAKAKGGAR